MSLRTAFVALTAAVLLSGSAAAAGPYPPPPEPGGQITPSRVEVGACATFSGQRFSANAEIIIRDNDKPAGTVKTDSKGQFGKRMCYGSTAQVGTHVITGTGLAAGPAPQALSVRNLFVGTAQADVVRTVSATLVVVGVSELPRADRTGEGGGSAVVPDGGTVSGSSAGTGGLPRTGFAVVGAALVGVVLLGLGSGVLLLTERRHRARRRLRRQHVPV